MGGSTVAVELVVAVELGAVLPRRGLVDREVVKDRSSFNAHVAHSYLRRCRGLFNPGILRVQYTNPRSTLGAPLLTRRKAAAGSY